MENYLFLKKNIFKYFIYRYFSNVINEYINFKKYYCLKKSKKVYSLINISFDYIIAINLIANCTISK